MFAQATGSITLNQSHGGPNGNFGLGGGAAGGLGASGGQNGIATPGNPGRASIISGNGFGGGLDLFIGGNVKLNNTNVTANQPDDIVGIFTQ